MALGVMEAEAPQIVVVRNTSSHTYTVRHNKRKFDILPDSELHLPWDAVASFMGDPRVIDVGRNKFRRALYDQVRGYNNFYMGFDTETAEQAATIYADTGERKGSWEEKKPPIEVYTIEGQRIFMLIDDPEGTLENPWGRVRVAEDNSNTAVLEQQIQRMQSQMDQLVGLLAQRQGSLPSQLADTPPTPTPIYVPSSPVTTSTGHLPTMEDGIRTDLLNLRNAPIPSPDQLFSDDTADAGASLPSAPSDSAVIKSDSPKSTKPVAKSTATPTPKSKS